MANLEGVAETMVRLHLEVGVLHPVVVFRGQLGGDLRVAGQDVEEIFDALQRHLDPVRELPEDGSELAMSFSRTRSWACVSPQGNGQVV